MCENSLNIFKPHSHPVMKYFMLPRQYENGNWVCVNHFGSLQEPRELCRAMWLCRGTVARWVALAFSVLLMLFKGLTECLLLAQCCASTRSSWLVGEPQTLQSHSMPLLNSPPAKGEWDQDWRMRPRQSWKKIMLKSLAFVLRVMNGFRDSDVLVSR